MQKLLFAAALCLSAALAAAPATTNQYITLDGTKLLSKPQAFAKAVKTLKKGMLVKVEKPKNGYVKATLPMGEDTVSGYLPVRAIQSKKPSMTASAKKSGDASAEEVAAATKGFNKQVEAELRSSQGGGYEKLDQAVARTAMEDPGTQLEGFREKGQLGEFKEEK
jgi:hypothetical protein